MRRIWIALAVSLLVPQASPAPPSAVPPAVYSVGAAIDESRQRLVVFGGYAGGRYAGDTWEWDGSSWSRFDGPGPGGRNSPAMAYDAARRVIVLFGGDTRATGALGDTWTFDGRAWRQAAMDGPPRRTTHHMVFDRARARVVLFGGVDGETMLGDTWEWDGTSWMRSSASGPTPRALFGLAYDAARQRTVLFGGTPRLAPDVAGLADTWEYDGTTWARIDVEGPSARDHVAMDFDHVSNQVVLHGGGLSDENKRETWRFDGARWEHVSTSGPPRRYARLLYDPVSQALLLYGGFDRAPSNELWRLTGTRWQRLPE